MGSAGRRDKAYVAHRKLYQTGQFVCHICGQRPGTTPDHIPGLHTYPPGQWQGTYKPACQPCQSQQGAQVTNARTRRRSRAW